MYAYIAEEDHRLSRLSDSKSLTPNNQVDEDTAQVCLCQRPGGAVHFR